MERSFRHTSMAGYEFIIVWEAGQPEVAVQEIWEMCMEGFFLNEEAWILIDLIGELEKSNAY